MHLLWILVVAAMCGTCQPYAVGRVHRVFPVSAPRCNNVVATVDDLNALALLTNVLDNTPCLTCGSYGGICGCQPDCGCSQILNIATRPRPTCDAGCTCYDCTAIVNTLVDALVKTVVNGNGGGGNPGGHQGGGGHNGGGGHVGGGGSGNSGSGGHNLIDLGLLQQGQNGGLDVLNLGLGNQGVLGLNLGGNSAGGKPVGGGPSAPGPAGSKGSGGNPNNLIQLDLLEQNKKGGLTVADLALGGQGVLGVDLGGAAP